MRDESKKTQSIDLNEVGNLGARSEARCCPYWSAISKACLLVKDGLFLPVQEHITAYCTSQYYLSCQHFQRLATSQNERQQEGQLPDNRRRSVRVPRYHIFRFSEITPANQSLENRQEESWTIDVCEHGLRFASYRHLTPDSMIRFSLEGEERLSPTQGNARVIWSRPLESTALFHTGIAFCG